MSCNEDWSWYTNNRQSFDCSDAYSEILEGFREVQQIELLQHQVDGLTNDLTRASKSCAIDSQGEAIHMLGIPAVDEPPTVQTLKEQVRILTQELKKWEVVNSREMGVRSGSAGASETVTDHVTDRAWLQLLEQE